jgi:hypothetical protein
LGRTLRVLREAGGDISVVRDVGGGAGAVLTDAVAAVLEDEATALVTVAAPPEARPDWGGVAATAREHHKPVVSVAPGRRPAPHRTLVEVPRRDLAATVSVLGSLRASGHGHGVVVVGRTEAAGRVREWLRGRGVCPGTLTQQAESRLQHLHLETLVDDAPPLDTPPTDTPPTALVAAATTTSECPDVGVVVMPLARPRSTADRRRLLAVLAGVSRAPTGAPVVAVVDGGLGGSALPVFADLPACLDVLRFAHDHATPGAGDGRWEP